jgi:uncharacterized protein UPF0175
MEVTIQIPDDIAASIQTAGRDLPRSVLEAYALEGYKTGQLSAYQVQKVLGFETPMELDGFLKAHEIYLDYSEDDVKTDTATSQRISARHRHE